MNFKLVEGHGVYQCAKFQGFLFSHLATRVSELSNNAKNRKIKLTSSLFIIYLHIELQSCRVSWSLLVCKISGIYIFAFGHQGSPNCQKMQKQENQTNIFPVHNLLTY